MKTRETLKITFLATISLAMLSACATDPPAVPAQAPVQTSKLVEIERLNLDIETGWKLAYAVQKPPNYQVREFVREGDDINSWKELLTVENFVKPQSGFSFMDIINRHKATMQVRCPNLTQLTIIEQMDNGILYEWTTKPCHIYPDTHDIGRIVAGVHSFYIVRYTAKVSLIAADVREKWLKQFRAALVEKVKG